MRKAIHVAIIDNKKILLVRKKQIWILPGGKPQDKESDLECLAREVGEELSGTKIANLVYYKPFIGKTPHTGDKILSEVYFASIDGKLGEPSSEIGDYLWMSNTEIVDISKITKQVMVALRGDGYL